MWSVRSVQVRSVSYSVRSQSQSAELGWCGQSVSVWSVSRSVWSISQSGRSVRQLGQVSKVRQGQESDRSVGQSGVTGQSIAWFHQSVSQVRSLSQSVRTVSQSSPVG